MNRITTFLNNISLYIPYIIITVVVLALIILVVLAYTTSRAVNKAKKRRLPAPPVHIPEPKLTTTPEPTQEPIKPDQKVPPIGGRFTEFLSLKGYFHVGEIGMTFLRAMELLRQRMDTYHYKYRLPWYLLIGPSYAGKTTLMDCSEQVLPLGKPDLGVKDDNPACRWWFTNRSIVLDIKGSLLISEEGMKSEENGWKTIVSLLARYRAKRPLDGIILTIPATELYGPHKLMLDEISARARFLAQKLTATQSHLGMQLPVYIVITKSDIIPGFKQVCQSIPHDNRHSMMGWSNPYTLNSAYTPAWIDEAFASIHNNLHKLRLEILAEDRNQDVQDGVFIFPAEIMHVQRHLTPYLNNIFKTTSYEEATVFRGIYFAGDAGHGFNIDDMSVLPEGDVSLEDEAYNLLSEEEKKEDLAYRAAHTTFLKVRIGEVEEEERTSNPHHIFFFNDLLNKKISTETGLARPIHSRLHRANRNLRIGQGAMLGFSVIGILGLMNAQDHFSKNRDYLLPVLGRINMILHETPAYHSGQSRNSVAIFEEQSRQLLEMMNNIEKASFFSIFMPASWFSHIPNKLRRSLKVSYDQIVLKTIFLDLQLKARDILNMRPTQKNVTTSLGVQMQPTATAEFQLFSHFLHEFILLCQNIEKYNKLKEVSDPKLIRDLVAYTLNVELPKDFIDNYKNFHKILHEIPYPKIEVNAYREPAQETLRILYFHFLNNMFSPVNENSISSKMHHLLNMFGDKKTPYMPAVAELRHISEDMNQFILTMGQPGNNWIDAHFFDPGNGFGEIMATINQFNLFGPKIIEKFATDTAIAFQIFHAELAKLNMLLIDRPYIQTDKVHHFSDGLFALQKGLALLFQESFMAQPTGEHFNPVVPENQVIFWNTKIIDFASQLVHEYDDFMAKNIAQLPQGLRETVKIVAHRNLNENIVNLIAKAQSYSTVRTDINSGYGAEEVLIDKISDVRTISPKFVHLLQTLEQGHLGESFVQLRTLLGTLSGRLLNQVQTLLNSYGLYQIRDGNFNWWDGKGSPIMQGFVVRDQQDLRDYLDKQRQIIRHLAMEYADPMVTFLSAPIMREYQGNDGQVVFWRRLIDQIKSSDKRSASGSLRILEDFLESNMCDLDLRSCSKFFKSDESKSSSGDFFIDTKQRISASLRERCEILVRQKNIENYQHLANLFNETLKGKFPFATGLITASTPEADPEDIRAFFRVYDDMGADPKIILDQIYQLGSIAAEPVNFIKNMADVRKFFDGFLNSDNESTPPSFDFSVDFRTNRDQEVNGNLIIEWVFSPSDTAKITNHDKKRLGRWIYEDTASLSLRWPKSSEVKPFRDKKQPLLTVDDDNRVATFAFSGKWSLLWLILKQSANGSDFSNMKDAAPYTLRFEVPNGPEEKTIVYNRITLLSPGKGKLPGRPLVIPNFPARAPIISKDLLNHSEKPILSQGYIDPISLNKPEKDKIDCQDKTGKGCKKVPLNPDLKSKTSKPLSVTKDSNSFTDYTDRLAEEAGHQVNSKNKIAGQSETIKANAIEKLDMTTSAIEKDNADDDDDTTA